MRELVINASWQ